MKNKLDVSIASFIEGFPVFNFSSLEFSSSETLKVFAFSGFDDQSKAALDHLQDSSSDRTVVIIDDAFLLKDLQTTDLAAKESHKEVVIVKDHMNLSTANPLLGPNNEARGQRFFAVNDVYVQPPQLRELQPVVVVGLNAGSRPKDSEKLILKLHSDCYSYNLVLASLVAAHHGFKVIGLLNLPEVKS